MKRNATHRSPFLLAAIPSGQGQFQFFRYQLGIVKEHLIEIAQSEEENAIFILFFYLQILLHHRRHFRHRSAHPLLL